MIAVFSNLFTGYAQNRFATNLVSYYLIEAICKYGIACIPILMMIKWGYVKKTTPQRIVKGFGIGALIIGFCGTNIMTYLVAEPKHVSVKWGVVLAIVLSSYAIGLMEETAIRGVVFPMLREKWMGTKHACLKAGIVSSLLFGLTLYSKSLIPIVFWHGLTDVTAFVKDGIFHPVSLQNVLLEKMSLQNALDKFGIMQSIPYAEELLRGSCDVILLVVGVLLILRYEKQEGEA